MCGPQRGAAWGALIFEGLAKDAQEADRLLASGKISIEPAHDHNSVAEAAQMISFSQAASILENGTGGKVYYTICMLKGLDIFGEDEETEVIVLISKPPGPSTAEEILKRVSKSPKKVIINFLGYDPGPISNSGAIPARTLQETAFWAVATLKGESFRYENFRVPEVELKRMVKDETERMARERKFLRGLYSGETLCD